MYSLQYFEADLTTIFTELEGEDMTIWLSSVPSGVSGWLYSNNSTKKIYGTPPQISNQAFWFYIYAQDVKLQQTYVNVTLTILYNYSPSYITSFPSLY
jgi:hypothetical protein